MFQDLVDRFEAANTNAERRAIREEFERITGRSQHWFYRMLKEQGWESGRKRRRDAGVSTQNAETLKMLAAVVGTAVRENGKATMSVPVARSILVENGIDFSVGDARLRTLLKRHKMDVQSQAGDPPAQYMRTLYPNHVHMVDPSLALVYYLPTGGQIVLHDDEVYKNKPFLSGKEHLKCWRYVLADHYSGSLCVRYYQSAGESSANLWDFLLYAWGMKEDPLYAFHGVPEVLIWDCGSANTSRAITRALDCLRVEVKPHLPGNPRAKGSVENGNNIVECGLESRLRFEPVESVEGLNALAERWCAAYNANRIDGLDCRITRFGQRIGSRLSLWQRITADQLRELPDAETCRLLLTIEPVKRKLDGHLSFSYDHPRVGRRFYQLYGQPGVVIGMEVQVRPILLERDLVVATWEHEGGQVSVELRPIELDEAGFAVEGAVYGREFKRPADTIVERNEKDLKILAYGTTEPEKKAVPFADFNEGEGLKAHSFISTGMDIKPAARIGKQVEISAPDVIAAHEIIITATEAAKRIGSRARLPEGYLESLKERYPEGVPASEVGGLVRELEERENGHVIEAKFG